jgi:hypothetical protein
MDDDDDGGGGWIARVTFPAIDGSGPPAAATLDAAMGWTCPAAPGTVAAVVAAVRLLIPDSPSQGAWEAIEAHEIARILGGTAEFAPRDAPPPGRIC